MKERLRHHRALEDLCRPFRSASNKQMGTVVFALVEGVTDWLSILSVVMCEEVVIELGAKNDAGRKRSSDLWL